MMGQKHPPNTLPAECGRCQGEFWAFMAEIHTSERAQIGARVSDIPVDIDPIFSFPEPIR